MDPRDETPFIRPLNPAPAAGDGTGAGRYAAPQGGPVAFAGAVAILALFGGAFTLAGGAALWQAWTHRARHEPNAWMLWPMAAAFLLIGLGFLYALVRGPAAIRKSEDTARRFPDEPWKWRDDWAQGYVQDDTKNAFGTTLVFALLWNLVSMPAGVIGWQKGVLEGQHAALMAFLFPLIGLFLVVNAAREGERRARFRVSRFDLDAVPVPLGRTLSGAVRTHLAELPAGGFHMTLSCVRTERTGTGSSSNTWTRVVWQDEATAPGRLGAPPPAPGETRDASPVVIVPVAFRVPAEAESTDHHDASNTVAWKLDVTAREPGVDYHAAFELPIYRTAETDRPENASDATHLRTLLVPSFPVEDAAALADAPRPAPASAISVTNDGDALVVDFPPARNRGAALGITAFALLWWALTVVLVRAHAPLVFPIVWTLMDIALGYGALWMWTAVTQVRIDRDGVAVASGLGQLGAPKRVARDDVADVRMQVGMTSGNTAYYDLKVVRKDGTTIGAGGAIRHKAEADWIAARMLKALGLAARA